MKGDFKINEFIKSPLTPLCQREVFSGKTMDFLVKPENDIFGARV
jgi:hypothetical protein